MATFAPIERQLGTDYTVLSLDLPGFGGSETPPSDWTLNDYAHFVAAFLDKTGQSKIYAILGHSNGGAIAIKALANGVISAEKLVLVASAGVRNQQSLAKAAKMSLAKAAKLPLAALPRTTRTKVKRRVYSKLGSDLYVAEHLQGTFKNVVSEDIQDDAKKLQLETLLIYGQNDTATPVRYGEILDSCLQHSSLKIVEGVGHFVHQERSEETAILIKDFLKQ